MLLNSTPLPASPLSLPLSAQIAQLRSQHDYINERNASITNSERRDASNRETMRDEYILGVRRRTERAFEQYREVMARHGDGKRGPSVVDELVQLIGELEEGLETLAVQPDAHALLTAGFDQNIFQCVASVGGLFLTRIAGEQEERAAAAKGSPHGDVSMTDSLHFSESSDSEAGDVDPDFQAQIDAL